MKKLVQINVVCNGSTGNIMCDIALKSKDSGFETYCFFGRGGPRKDVNCIKITNKFSVLFHLFLARIGFNGYGSYFSTKKLIKSLRKINPDVIHLHNIHGYYLNLNVLFNYLKEEYKGKIVWTLHDCWAFTGHCAHFSLINCNKWQKECFNCPQLNTYPKEYFDTTKREFNLKRKLFVGLPNLTIVTPSKWLAGLAKLSFLNKYKIEVINNGINLDKFKPVIDNNIYMKYGIPMDKKIILGVANGWNERKGFKDFIELSKIVDDDFSIVLVGALNNVKKNIPDNIIMIERTENQHELAKIYTAASVFLNPTYEDNYPTTNLESIACGTPIVCYNTGGCEEQVKQFKHGVIVEKGNISLVADIINNIVKEKKQFKKNNDINVDYMKNKYVNLYK